MASLPCIAVVDDEALVRTALGRLLRLGAYEVLPFASGDAFLASLSQRIPDCVLLDVHMPGLSGLQVQARLRATQPDLPVLFISATVDAEVERSALVAGGLRVLHKPFSGSALLDAVGRALRVAPPGGPDHGDVPN